MIGGLNQTCQNVYCFEDLLDEESIFNLALSKRISRLIIGAGKGKYITPNEEMYKDL